MKTWPMGDPPVNGTSGILNFLKLLLGVYLGFIEKSSNPAKVVYSSALVLASNLGAGLGLRYFGEVGWMAVAVSSALVVGMMLSAPSGTFRRLLKRANSRVTDTPQLPPAE